MELGTGSLLGLNSGEMLNVVDLHVGHKCTPVPTMHSGTMHSGDEESHMLLSSSEDSGTSSTSCIASSMDFEFPNNDLGTSDFSMEHSSVFDIPESVIDENEKVELFTDSGLFDEHSLKNNGELESLTNLNFMKLNLYKEMGLKLQVIPLNNLQFVSTVQTSEGVHILAVPAGSSYRDCGMGNTLISNIILQSGIAGISDKSAILGDVNQLSSMSCKSQPTFVANTGPKIEIFNLLPKSETIPMLQKPDKLVPVRELNVDTKVLKCIESKDIALKHTSMKIAQPVTLLKPKGNGKVTYQSDKRLLRELKDKETVILKGTKSNASVSPITSLHVANKMVSLLKSQTQRSNAFTLFRPENNRGQTNVKVTTCIKKQTIPEKKKIIVDFQELIPKKVQNNMVSLLNTPLTRKVLALKKTNKEQEVNKHLKVIIRVKTKRPLQKKDFLNSIKHVSNDNTEERELVRMQEKKETEKNHMNVTLKMKSKSSISSECNAELRQQSAPSTRSLGKRSKITDYDEDTCEERSLCENVANKIHQFRSKSNVLDDTFRSSESINHGHKCTVCKAVFTRKGNFQNHMEVHDHISDDRLLKQTTFTKPVTIEIDERPFPSQCKFEIPNETSHNSSVLQKNTFSEYSQPAQKKIHPPTSVHFENTNELTRSTLLHESITTMHNSDIQDLTILGSSSASQSTTQQQQRSIYHQCIQQSPGMTSSTHYSNKISSPALHKHLSTTTSCSAKLSLNEECSTTTCIDEMLSSAQIVGCESEALKKRSVLDIITVESIKAQQTSPDVLTGLDAQDTPISRRKTACKTSQFMCDLCNMTFVNEGNLTRHRLNHVATAKGVARFKCDVCPKSFLQKCDLRRHKIQHSQQFPFTCKHCGKGFIRRSDLTVHERFHTREKTFQCDQCYRAYFQSGDLYRHKKNAHADCADFACQQCGKKYMSQKGLMMHVKHKHLPSISTH